MSLQRTTAFLSLLIATFFFAVGVFLVAFSETSLWRYRPSEHDDNGEKDSVLRLLSQLTGASLVLIGTNSLSMIIPSLCATFVDVEKVRTSILQQAIAGLAFFGIGISDIVLRTGGQDDSIEKEEFRTIREAYQCICYIGFGIMIISCVSLMLSFWPAYPESENTNNLGASPVPAQTNGNSSSASRIVGEQEDESERNQILTSLLSAFEESNNEEDTEQNDEGPTTSSYQLLEETPTVESQINAEEPAETSRIRGTMRLLQLARPQVFYLYVGCAVLLLRLPFSLCIPHFVSTTLGAVSRNDFGKARSEVLLLFLAGTIDAALDFWCVFLFGFANQKIVRDVRIGTFVSILRQEIGFFDRHASGELASRLNSDCGEMAGDLTWFFRFSIESVVRITGITAYMLVRSPTLAACALSIVPVVAIVNKFYGNWLSKNAREVQDALAEANSAAQEAFACIRTVIAFASERLETEKYTSKVDRQYQLNVRQLYLTGVYYMFISTFLVNTLVQATLLSIGTYLIQKHQLTGEVLLAFMLYQGQLQNETMNLFQSYSSLIKSSGAGDKVFALLDRLPPPPGTGSDMVQISESNVTTIQAPMEVVLRNIRFAYPSRPDQEVLKGLDVKIKPGQTVALVGESGCGKSTIIGLIQRFYDPNEGQISVDGVDLREIDVKMHRRRIGVVTQDPILFRGTVLSNITYGLPNVTKQRAIEAAKLANAHPFIMSFPDGYESEVGEGGVLLSGGQKQRIAISRAIIRSPSLCIFDEATSALDAESEELVQVALDQLLERGSAMTTIIIAHRLRTVRNADIIVFIQNGRAAEIGSHDELMTREKGLYANMVARSSGDRLPED